MKKGRIEWLDGLKGFACLCVFAHHFLLAFYPETYWGSAAREQLLPASLAQNFAMAVFNGNYLVALFCTISGIVISVSVMGLKEKERISNIIVKRYFRLVLPVFAFSSVIFVMMKLGVFSNSEVGAITGNDWFVSFYPAVDLKIKDLFETSFILVLFGGNSAFCGVFWMLKTIFLGSFLSILLSMLSWNFNKNVIWVYFGVALVYIRMNSLELTFVLGTILAYCLLDIQKNSKIHSVLGFFLCFVGYFLGGYPSGIEPQNYYRFLNICPGWLSGYQFWHMVGAAVTLLGIMLWRSPQKFFANRVGKMFGKISFAVYLVHFPVMCSFSSTLFLHMINDWGMGYHVSVGITFLCSIAVIILCSWIFYRFIEGKCARLTEMLLGKLQRAGGEKKS